MTTFLYLLITALIFGVIGYILKSITCSGSGERYLATTPTDPVTEDDGSCEDEDAKAAKAAAQAEADAKAAEAQRVLEEEEQAKAEAEEQAAQEKAAQEKAEQEKAKAEKAAAAAKAKEEAEAKAAAEKAAKAEAKAKKEAEEAAKAESAAEASKAEQSTETQEEPEGVAPEGLLDAPRDGKKDNLTRIKGIGVKIDAALNGIGIYHFDQIAVWTEENMAWADKALAFPGRAKRDDWVGQAKLLAKGKETEFSKRVDKGQVSSSKKA